MGVIVLRFILVAVPLLWILTSGKCCRCCIVWHIPANWLYFLIHRNNYLFWSDINNDRIWRSGLDGSNPRVLLSSGIPCVCMFVYGHVILVLLLITFELTCSWACLGLGEPEALLDRLLWWWLGSVRSCCWCQESALFRLQWTSCSDCWSDERVCARWCNYVIGLCHMNRV